MRSARIRATGGRRILPTVAGAVAVLVLAPSAFAETESIRYEYGENGTWTVPADVTEVTVKVAGAGGGGIRDSAISGGSGALVQASVAVSSGDTLTIGVGGGGDQSVGTSKRGAGGGGASIVTSPSSGLTDVLIIAGGGGGAGQGGNTSRSGNGGSAGSNTDGSGADGDAIDFVPGGIAGGSGSGGAYLGSDYVIGSTSPTNGSGGARTELDGTRAASVGGQGGAAGSRGGNGGAGYGGGGLGSTGTVDSIAAAAGGGAGASIAQGTAVAMVEGLSTYYSTSGGSGGVQSAGAHGWVMITWVVPVPEPDVETSGESVPQEPVIVSLAMPPGMECSAPASPPSGAWIQLPGESECAESGASASGLDDAPGLLGWATRPDFPVAIAQRQVDNGWGAYEIERADGSLEAVFIPAGGWTQASSDTTLFPIWAD